MAKGPKYRVAFRRRREGKTNFSRRLKLIKSRRNRLVIRCTLKHISVQVSESQIKGDKTLVYAYSKQLIKEFGWLQSTSNLPAAYLTGYLAGLRAKKINIEDAILDVGILVHNERVKAAFLGFLEAGIEVPHDSEWFSEALKERINGSHIQNYAQTLQKEDKDKYRKLFAAVLKNKGDPTKITDDFNKTKQSIEKKV